MLKRFINIFFIVVFSFAFALNVFAENAEVRDGFVVDLPSVEDVQIGCYSEDSAISTRATYNYSFVGTRTYRWVLRYYDYLCYKDIANSWYAMLGLNLTGAVYHSNGSGDKNLSFTIAQSYSEQTAGAFSTSVGGEAGVGDMVKASASFNCGIEETIGREYQISSSIQATIPASAKTGYYKMHVCHNFFAMKIIQQLTDGTNQITRHIAMPYGEPYAAVLYSSNASSWALW